MPHRHRASGEGTWPRRQEGLILVDMHGDVLTPQAAPKSSTPIMYGSVVPLSSELHRKWRLQRGEACPWASSHNVVPLLADEFFVAQRDYAILFAAAPQLATLAVMGRPQEANSFVDATGRLRTQTYLPAYIRRYPFILARQNPDSEALTLCFDATSGLLGPDCEGDALFKPDSLPSPETQAIVKFCEKFEQAGKRTETFVREVEQAGLLIDDQINVPADTVHSARTYNGFRMVDEARLAQLDDDALLRLARSGALALIHAHLFSLGNLGRLYERKNALA